MHGQVTGPVYALYYPILAAFGAPANILTIVILSRGRCGLSRCITRYLVGMAVTDLLVIITGVILNRISVIYFPVVFLSITPVCSLKIVLFYAARDSSVWLTVAFTFDRFVAICCQQLKAKHCTGRTAAMVIVTMCALSCLKNIPWYFVYEPLYIINDVPWYCNIKLSFYFELAWTVFDWIDRISNPGAPFLLMLLFNALTVRHILATSRARRRLRAHSKAEKQIDPEIESRRKSIVLLFTISGTFILLWMTYIVNFLYVRITNDYNISGFNDPKFILQESGNMLQLLSCCTNTCIYAVTQTKFREEFMKMLKSPVNLIIKVVKY
ncbi:probable G-protein coupled receptor 139 [Heterodontus francisci]|uniref:probable G-protein coupled receptor 139 n=1 Tax=Heterodontus francisci TaxID=7792 RepID=UPI00355C5E99